MFRTLCARCVRPSFSGPRRHLASGSWGLAQSVFEVFFFRVRSNRARTSRVGVLIPDAACEARQIGLISVPRIPSHDDSAWRRWLPTSWHRSRPWRDTFTRVPAATRRAWTHVNTARCVLHIDQPPGARGASSDPWCGVLESEAASKSPHRAPESAARQAMPRSESGGLRSTLGPTTSGSRRPGDQTRAAQHRRVKGSTGVLPPTRRNRRRLSSGNAVQARVATDAPARPCKSDVATSTTGG